MGTSCGRAHIRPPVAGWRTAHDWNRHCGMVRLRHLAVWVITLLGHRVSVGCERGDDFRPVEIKVVHGTWPSSVTTGALRVKPVGVKVAIEVFCLLASFEAEEDEQNKGEDRNSTAHDATGDGAHIRSGG